MSNSSPLPDFLIQKRINDLQDNLAQDIELIKLFEDAIRYEINPRLITKYKRDLEGLYTSLQRYQKEYNELQAWKVSQSLVIRDVADQLLEMNTRLDQVQISLQTIRWDLHDMKQAIISRYELGEQEMMEAIIARLDQNQLTTTQMVLDAIEGEKQFDIELLQIINALPTALEAAQHRGFALPASQDVIEVIESPKFDIGHKLKVSIPLIPVLLTYEGEISLGSGMNLEKAWEMLVAKVKAFRHS